MSSADDDRESRNHVIVSNEPIGLPDCKVFITMNRDAGPMREVSSLLRHVQTQVCALNRGMLIHDRPNGRFVFTLKALEVDRALNLILRQQKAKQVILVTKKDTEADA